MSQKDQSSYSRRNQTVVAAAMLILGVMWIRFDHLSTFNFDPHNKLYQVHSLLARGFASENLIYSGEDLDPEHAFFPLDYTTRLADGRTVSAFPIALAVIGAPVYAFLGARWLPILGLLSLFALWLLFLRWKPHTTVLVAMIAGNFLWLLSFDYSEYLIVPVLSLAGLRLLFRTLPCADSESSSFALDRPATERGRQTLAFLAGLLIGFTVWLRHEGLVFGGALLGSLILILISPFRRVEEAEDPERRAEIKRLVALFALGFALPAAAWATHNLLDYGHVLGPRFFVNRAGFLPPLSEVLRRYRNLLLVGDAKAGLFAFLPFLPVLIVRSIVIRFRGGPLERILLLTVGTFILCIPAVVPNDGINGLGPRYLILAVVPAFLLAELWYANAARGWRWVFIAWVALSAALPLGMFVLYRKGAAYQRALHDAYAKTPADIRVFPSLPLYYYYGADTPLCECYIASGNDKLADLLSRLHQYRPGKSITLIHLNTNLLERQKKMRPDNSALQAETAKAIAASRWDTERIRDNPNLSTSETTKFQDVEIWTGRIAATAR